MQVLGSYNCSNLQEAQKVANFISKVQFSAPPPPSDQSLGPLLHGDASTRFSFPSDSCNLRIIKLHTAAALVRVSPQLVDGEVLSRDWTV